MGSLFGSAPSKASSRQEPSESASTTLISCRNDNGHRLTFNERINDRAFFPSLSVGRWMFDVECCRQRRRGTPANCAPALFVFVATEFHSRSPARRGPSS